MSIFLDMFSCCRRPFGAIPLYNDDLDSEYIFRQTNASRQKNAVHLDISTAGQFAVVLKNNTRICGSGAVRANAPIMQDKAYFEVKVQTTGTWAVGLCLTQAKLNSAKELKKQAAIWALYNDSGIYHESDEKLLELEHPVEEGDVVGLFYDHTELTFSLNGLPVRLRAPPNHGSFSDYLTGGLTGIRGTVYPFFATDDGAILDTRFNAFCHPPPNQNGFGEIRLEHNII